MIKNVALIYFNLLFITFSFCQVTSIDSLETKMDRYFELDYETFFTHVNKTTYFVNEEIWFKTYVYNTKKQLPYLSTTNVYTCLYDENGKLIKKKVYAAENAMVSGNIKIDSFYSTGTYYLKTYTNWSRNFDLDYSHIQKIEIVNEKKPSKKEELLKLLYDIQLLPEGGHFIEGTINSVGFKILNSLGESVDISSGKILDSKKNIITIFKSNQFGLGKFVFKPEIDENYSCEITLKDGEIITQKITGISSKGIHLNVDNNRLENININLNTNNNTLPELINKPYYLIIHRDGLIKKMAVKFSENKLNYSYNINRKLLLKGINIITLINERQEPIAERIIFNNDNSQIKTIEISQIIKEKDSSIVKLQTDSAIKNINLSVSVLPAKTKAHDSNSSIISSFQINPYIKGTIENPWYYFNKINREKAYNLDLLLLTQGWSKYSWKNIFNQPPKISHNFETGFQVKGKINNYNYKSGDKIILQSMQNGLREESSINESGIFNFNNLYLRDSSKVNFSLKNKKGNQSKPSIYYNIYPSNSANNILVKNSKEKKIIQSNTDNTFIYDENVNMLEGVELQDVNNKPKPINKRIGSSLAKHINFADGTNSNSLITDQLQNYFDTSNYGGNVSILSRKFRGLYGARSPRVYLDNVDISSDLNRINNLRVHDVEEMFVNTGTSNLHNATGVIQIFTKRGQSKPAKSKFNGSEIDFGFSDTKEYYSPLYNRLNQDGFKDYGVLNWTPNITKSANGELSFKIPNYYYDTINLYIEGMGEDGSLFSKKETISID